MLQADYALRNYNAFGFDVHARIGGLIRSETALAKLRTDKCIASMPRIVLGAGSNIVFTRDFDGLALVIDLRGKRIVSQTDDAYIVEGAAGERWHDFVYWTLQQGMPGLENLALIPGTVGAAPVQNIGAYGLELVERFERLRAFDMIDGRIVELNVQECAFGYRDSIFKNAARGQLIILSVIFRLPKRWYARDSYADITSRLAMNKISEPTAQQIFDVVTAIRREKLPDPAVLGNVGSFFKNPIVSAEYFAALQAKEPDIVFYAQCDSRVKLSAGWMIDQCGWKERSIGGAAVHKSQALVLVNRGGATGEQVLELAQVIRADVRQRFGVELDIEPLVV
ncbi:UDP-N-acetylmuramate dehydrogenase [Candidatus Vallotiella sp. (ex Adelges kitamiensis)]|uniref:UDP-N-acetylmuramate dehydrogenase n=1 Tax=Candidatus Vallotiella sp. (ex Adelges kitamiensis) TaxID=2864217 RepID=UPI001CE29938|nr:UDP-N-acetylmuramate dehydrogenase [Candidatus Vallotia sp. (ex Adelges kitamiensis)]